MNKKEDTGYGFSADGGHSFVDLGGLPNAKCDQHLFHGDPAVEAWQSDGASYFYISSMYTPMGSQFAPPTDQRSFIALSGCQVINYIPLSCLALTPTSPCTSGPVAVTTANIVSMAAAAIPGYNRFPMNDFPRIAVSDTARTVSIVCNDARLHPVGDILLQSYALGSLRSIQATPVRINSSVGGWHFMPAMRQSAPNGNLEISFFSRTSGDTALTDVYAALNVSPLITRSPASNLKITTGASGWNAVSSNIQPNFGGYIDNYLIATPSSPFVGNVLYVAWSDGRLGLPQSFEDHVKA